MIGLTDSTSDSTRCRSPHMPSQPPPPSPPSRPPNWSFVEFSAPDVEEQTRVRTTKTDMWWIGISRRGLTYEGTCRSSACIASSEGLTTWPGRTSCKKTLGSYRPNEDYDYSRVKCPACGRDFFPERFVFMNCSVEVHYRLAGQQPRKVNFTVRGDNEIYVLGTPGRQAVYTSLVLDVQAPNSDLSEAPDHAGSVEEGGAASQPHLLSF
eukprot:TRINITY_DN7206_c0_g1_i1.p1 TRINITY_DN7206_c0_g1~~TRINITY_DN7206_c0_g1_i1.p1  ORF type:complete len:209 (-),score=13.11 TRINITY_DN7206_c0_g1_i1:174-800(-)